mmetsp:Transcript_10065/g.27590  ORF Transcript_10065/g.27590 Transcript_10065/m.27590 type:complete len:392 (-) Transcript_10065:101-1276(-)
MWPLTGKRFLVSFLALANGAAQGSSTTPEANAVNSNANLKCDCCCRSNSTHLAWIVEPPSNDLRAPCDEDSLRLGRSERRGLSAANGANPTDTPCCTWQTRDEAQQEALEFLRNHVMEFDQAFLHTLGFPVEDNRSNGTDGLDDGLVGPTIQLALDAKVMYPWTDALSKSTFFNYVLNYANLNEARTNWRPLLVDVLNVTQAELWKEYVATGNWNVTSVVKWVNTVVWDRLGRNGQPIRFVSGQTPLIFDPMSVIAFGYSSCTGTAILFTNALRAVGIPARVAGTAAWYGDASKGNHNWVEVYDSAKDEWGFLEPAPNTPGTVESLESNPCGRWYCSPDRYPSSTVFAAKLSQEDDCCCDKHHFPLAWEPGCEDVPADDRTKYYTDVCSQC